MKDQKTLDLLREHIAEPCNTSNCCQPCVDCKQELMAVVAQMEAGHSYHCATRRVWGDGECECRLPGFILGAASAEVLAAQGLTVGGSRYGRTVAARTPQEGSRQERPAADESLGLTSTPPELTD